MVYTLRKTDLRLTGELTLAGSKSIANRALVIRALCGEDFPIAHLANAKDTQLLQDLLESDAEIRDAGAAGTTFRFLTAYLALLPGTQVLTGTDRMKQRPIGLLVEALRKHGARIHYLENKGYPPLRIGPPQIPGKTNRISIPAGTSSQYISALLLIAPTMPRGLELTLKGKVVSRPYINMTLALMAYFGVRHEWRGEVITVAPQAYRARPFTVEADWSAASYYYAMAALADEVELTLNGLYEDSIQGDAVLPKMMRSFGVVTEYDKTGIRLRREGRAEKQVFEWDFLTCPDLAQTLAVTCAGLGVEGRFTGLETLRIKETDRIAALQRELAKVNASIDEMPTAGAPRPDRTYFRVSGQALVRECPSFATYEDHRMAMAMAPLALLGDIAIQEPEVVVKSYPDFWKDLEKVGFEVGRTTRQSSIS